MRTCKPNAKPVDIRETARDTIKRFPLTMALLASPKIYGVVHKSRLYVLAYVALAGCAQTPASRYIETYCLTQQQFYTLKSQEPGRVHDQLNGQADHDLQIIAGNDIRLRAFSDGILQVLGGCVSPSDIRQSR